MKPTETASGKIAGRKVPRPPKTPRVKKEQKTGAEMLVFEIDRALQLLVDTCETTSKNLKSDFIPLDMLKTYKKTIIVNYEAGLKTNPNFK